MQIMNTPSMLICPDSKRVEGLNEIGVAELPGMYPVPAGESREGKICCCRGDEHGPDLSVRPSGSGPARAGLSG